MTSYVVTITKSNVLRIPFCVYKTRGEALLSACMENARQERINSRRELKGLPPDKTFQETITDLCLFAFQFGYDIDMENKVLIRKTAIEKGQNRHA